MGSKSCKGHGRLQRLLLALLLAVGALSLAQAQSRGGGQWHGGSGGGAGQWHGGSGGAGGWHGQAGYRHGYPGYGHYYRPYYGGWYGGWYGGYWGPRVGLYWGPGYWGAWPYAYAWGYPYVYSSSTPLVLGSTVPQAQSYIQQDAAPSAGEAPPAPTGYWYYCRQPAGYFPYVKDCNQPWLKVVPQAPGEATAPRLVQ